MTNHVPILINLYINIKYTRFKCHTTRRSFDVIYSLQETSLSIPSISVKQTEQKIKPLDNTRFLSRRGIASETFRVNEISLGQNLAEETGS